MAVRKNYTVNWPSGLNLREKASKDSNILARLAYEEKVTIDPKAEAPEGWVAVVGGGYVMSEYLK